MRIDQAISLYLARPLNALLPQGGTKVPILMYHRVPEFDECKGHPYYCTNTTVAVFERQMRFLHENGYRTVSVPEAYQAVQSLVPNPGQKLVAITFDDGYRDFYTNAFPILNRYGLSATMFLPTAYIGDSARRFKDCDCLTWNEVRELRRAGVEFGSHTVTHPQLRAVTREQLQKEIRVSKTEIEQRLGRAADTFSYPYAFPETDRSFADGLQYILAENGYRHGVSTIIGRAAASDNRFYLKRLPLNSHDDQRFLEAKTNGSYDWLHAFQYLSKLRNSRN
jgi:peptidoglycan/xylan/chitin deacetylase (PgdA/CDA1 family)